jgi:predicted MPP superfamily phosphohydrolase
MSKETLEDLKAIIAGKPKGVDSTHVQVVDGEFQYFNSDGFSLWSHDIDDLAEAECILNMRSLSDIERIIELMEATQGMLQLFAGTPDGYWRNEIQAARKALGYE